MGGGKKEPKAPSGPRIPKHMQSPQFADFHFYDMERIETLFAKRRDWYLRLLAARQAAREEAERRAAEGEEGVEPKKAEDAVVLDSKELDANDGWTKASARRCARHARGRADWYSV